MGCARSKSKRHAWYNTSNQQQQQQNQTQKLDEEYLPTKFDPQILVVPSRQTLSTAAPKVRPKSSPVPGHVNNHRDGMGVVKYINQNNNGSLDKIRFVFEQNNFISEPRIKQMPTINDLIQIQDVCSQTNAVNTLNQQQNRYIMSADDYETAGQCYGVQNAADWEQHAWIPKLQINISFLNINN